MALSWIFRPSLGHADRLFEREPNEYGQQQPLAPADFSGFPLSASGIICVTLTESVGMNRAAPTWGGWHVAQQGQLP